MYKAAAHKSDEWIDKWQLASVLHKGFAWIYTVPSHGLYEKLLYS